jgi:hypothetical protein
MEVFRTVLLIFKHSAHLHYAEKEDMMHDFLIS